MLSFNTKIMRRKSFNQIDSKKKKKFKNAILNLLDIVFDEKQNFSKENNYLDLCNGLHQMMDIADEYSWYSEYEKENNMNRFLTKSRNRLMKEVDGLHEKLRTIQENKI